MFIETSFSGFGIPNPKKDNNRWKTTQYIDHLVEDKPRIMRKINKVNYANIFSSDFKSKSIDKKLNNLEPDEKLRILTHVIDYLYQNFKSLKKEIGL